MGKPSARISDLHTCPMATPGTPPVPHVGGPISGPCVPTVLVGFLPAAVVGDSCVCVGPPDTITMGSPTVLIGNKMAARMGDPTLHGGVITAGFPSVLIGEMGRGDTGGAGLKALCPKIESLNSLPLDERLKQEQALLTSLPTSYPSLSKVHHDRDLAVLASAPYARKDGSPAVLPPGYARVSTSELGRLGLSPSLLNPDIQVFSTKNPNGSNHYVMSFRGTELNAGLETTKDDVGTDIAQACGFNTSAYERGMEASSKLAIAAKNNGDSAELTGHSKGGGQAAASSTLSGLPATTFNAAGVHPRTLDRAEVTPDQYASAQTNIRAYHNERDPLNMAQDNRGTILGGLGVSATMLHGLIGASAVAALAADGALPQAIGQRIPVPPASTQGTGLAEGHSIDTMIQALNEQVTNQFSDICGC